MAKFKIGDRVRVFRDGIRAGAWLNSSIGKNGTITEDSDIPWVVFDDGTKDWGSEGYLELIEPTKPKIEPLTISVTAELTHITIGGNRFRLVPED